MLPVPAGRRHSNAREVSGCAVRLKIDHVPNTENGLRWRDRTRIYRDECITVVKDDEMHFRA
jgi:hypothetical protein